jgi:hypothetical protein
MEAIAIAIVVAKDALVKRMTVEKSANKELDP